MNPALEPKLVLFGLVLSRVSGMIVGAPLLWNHAPVRSRAILVLLLSAFAMPLIATGPLTIEQGLRSAPQEVLLGLAMGLVVRFGLAVAHMLGDLFGPMFGLSAAMLIGSHDDPMESAIGRIMSLLLGFVAVTVGLHRVVLSGLLASFAVVVPGSTIHAEAGALVLAGVSQSMIALGLSVAMPVLAAHMLLQTTLAFVSRSAPQMQIFSVGFAAALVVGLVTFNVALPDMVDEITRSLGALGADIERILFAVSGR